MINVKVYIGPTIPGVATHGTIYNNGPSRELEEAMKKEPAFKGLLVPVDKLSVVITLALAFLILHEPVTSKNLIGCGLIAAGTLFMVL